MGFPDQPEAALAAEAVVCCAGGPLNEPVDDPRQEDAGGWSPGGGAPAPCLQCRGVSGPGQEQGQNNKRQSPWLTKFCLVVEVAPQAYQLGVRGPWRRITGR